MLLWGIGLAQGQGCWFWAQKIGTARLGFVGFGTFWECGNLTRQLYARRLVLLSAVGWHHTLYPSLGPSLYNVHTRVCMETS